jgi:ParB/RepB/Spo0J family partition protein
MTGATSAAVRVATIAPSATNPRKNFDEGALGELASSISMHGVLQPVVVRPWPAERKHPKGFAETPLYELVVGERRWRAARIAGLEEIPASVREMTDDQVAEVQVVENLQRTDLHPLEEAEGYRQLMAKRYDVARIAERTGHGVRYVYDRVKLLSLTKEAQKIFLEGRITIGHAIVLARLSPADQARALGDNEDGPGRPGSLWQDERLLFNPEDDGAEALDQVKPVSVRELEAWVDEHVKLEAAQADPMLFPDLVATVKEAAEAKEKVVRITHEQITPEDAKDGPRPILGRSWKRADGKRGSKECDRSVIGNIVIGPARGEVLRVCVDKKHCTVHWGEVIKAAKKREREATKGGTTGEDREVIRRLKQQEEEARAAADNARWDKARPAILEALAAAVRKAPAGAGSETGKLVLEACRVFLPQELAKTVEKLAPAGRSAEDLVRHLAVLILADNLTQAFDEKEVARQAKAFGVDVPKILAAAAPEPAKAKVKAGKKAR